ncbi:hypothetical protein VTJ83DRAFT_6481 [Remersonia thermophila]|uniref:BHLH domain-containing protein n=1 Tax=Remersonia thermophila TaxID=72144 RepID=A0ABR4D4U1_9PEZI
MDHAMGAAAGGFRSKFPPSSFINPGFEPPLQPDFDEPPAPSGNPLLDNNELQYLTSFLLGVNSTLQNGAPADPPGFPDLFHMHHIHTEDWRTPFEVVGHNVTYGDMQLEDGIYADEAHLTSAILGSMLPAASGSDQPQPPRPDRSDVPGEADAFAAALALTHAGQSFHPTYRHDATMSPADGQPGQPGHQHQHQHPIPYRMASGQPQSGPFSFGAAGPHHGGPSPAGPFAGSRLYSKRPRVPHDEVRFGSDPSFNRNTFVPRSAKDTTEALSAIQMETLKCLERTESAAPTRAQSPVSFPPHAPDARTDSLAFSPRSLRTNHAPQPALGADHDGGSARKRRRSNKDGDGYDAPAHGVTWAAGVGGLPTPAHDGAARRPAPGTTAAPADPASQPRKLPPGGAPPLPEAPPAKKGRGGRRAGAGPAAPGPKPRRQNLTKEEKRQRHNQSEQRRRGYTKNNYEALRSLIPEVRDGRHSKAATLRIVADLLESMHLGNDDLRRKVDEVAPGRMGPSVLEMSRQKKKKKEGKKRKEMAMAQDGGGKLVMR